MHVIMKEKHHDPGVEFLVTWAGDQALQFGPAVHVSKLVK